MHNTKGSQEFRTDPQATLLTVDHLPPSGSLPATDLESAFCSQPTVALPLNAANTPVDSQAHWLGAGQRAAGHMTTLLQDTEQVLYAG